MNGQHYVEPDDLSFAGRCRGKVRHPSKGHANSALRRLQELHGPSPTLQAYRCRDCKKWHLGNTHETKYEIWLRERREAQERQDIAATLIPFVKPPEAV